MPKWQYTKGLHDIGSGCFAWLQPDGGWGWSNAGLITDGDDALLVDTLFDLKLTAEMLARMRDASPAARDLKRLVNTHANGDHTFGNQLLGSAEIIGSEACLDEYMERPPEVFRARMANWRAMGEGGAFFHEVMGSRFDWDGLRSAPPNRIFNGEMRVKVGDKEVVLLEVGPAHTRGDILVHVPADRILFTGDILFVQGHPVIWAGPVENWIRACDTILGWDVEVVVPGHGPITDKSGVRSLRDYLIYMRDEARRRFDAGMSAEEAALDIPLGPYADWGDPERVVINTDTLFRQFAAETGPRDNMALFARMSAWRRRRLPHCADPNCAAPGHLRAERMP